MKLKDLQKHCIENNINCSGNRNKIVKEIIKNLINNSKIITFSGIVEKINNFGFVRDINHNFLPTDYDLHINRKIISEHRLKTGDEIVCIVSNDYSEDQKLFTIKSIISVNGSKTPRNRQDFEDLTPTYPKEQAILEFKKQKNDHLSNQYQEYNKICRIIDK